MAKSTSRRKHGRARPRAARRHVRRTAASPGAFRPDAPIRENESEDQAGAYGGDRGETDLIQP